jgi:hypothetical protein
MQPWRNSEWTRCLAVLVSPPLTAPRGAPHHPKGAIHRPEKRGYNRNTAPSPKAAWLHIKKATYPIWRRALGSEARRLFCSGKGKGRLARECWTLYPRRSSMRLALVMLLLPFALCSCLSFSSSNPPPPAHNTTVVVPPGSTVVPPPSATTTH